MTVFLPEQPVEPMLRPWWYHPETPALPPPAFPSIPDPAYAAGCQLVRLADSIADVFARCEWCRRPTPGLLADCAEPDCPGGMR